MRYYFDAMQQQHHGLPLGDGVLISTGRHRPEVQPLTL